MGCWPIAIHISGRFVKDRVNSPQGDPHDTTSLKTTALEATDSMKQLGI